MSAVTVVRVGYGVTTQDLGRPGFSDMGLGAAGAADRGAAALAGRMVGNRPGAAVLEALLGSVALRTDAHVVAAVTGAAGPVDVERADGRVRGAAPYEVLMLEPGDVLHLGVPETGLRSYIAVRGGFAVEPVLGSRSWDSLAQLGPAPLRVGDVLPVGDDAEAWPVVDAVAPPSTPLDTVPVVLDVVPGPRDDWFTPGWRSTLTGQDHVVSADSDRVGVRTTAATPLVRAVTGELPSEGVETGSLQVPPEGSPVLFLADHPVTGGYPVVAVLTPASVDRAAQLRPGDVVRFRLPADTGTLDDPRSGTARAPRSLAMAGPASTDAPHRRKVHPMTQTVFLEVQLRSDVSEDQVAAAVRETLAQTAQRPGNESLEVLVDDADPTRMVVLERWATSADHDAYVAWRATPEGAAEALGAVLAAPPVTRTFARTIPLG